MFTVYRASAGSGKTFTLVKEYLRICLQSDDIEKYRHILAITFTNKACNEMKERIIRTLHGFSGEGKTDKIMLQKLAKESGKTEEEIRDFSAKMLQKMLQDYSALSISTIDSFIHKVIRSFAYELDIPHNFEVHLERDELLDAIVANVLDEVSDDEQQEITKALIEFTESKIDESSGWNIESALRDFASELLREDSFLQLEKVAAIPPEKITKLIKQLRVTTSAFEQKINIFGTQILDLIASQGLTADDFSYKKSGIFGYFVRLKNFPEKDLEFGARGLAVLETGKWTSSKDLMVIDKIDAIKEQLHSLILTVHQYENEYAPQYYLAKLIAKNINQIRVAEAISRALAKVKDDKNILPVNEFQTIISAIVSEQEAPVIYERIGERYDSILIDEFQDTSLLQFRNLLPLIENAQFKSEDSLVVGDAKQSIYRFKGGEAQQLVDLPLIYGSDTNEILKSREIAINNYKTQTETLKANYRSRQNVIEFNNEFYNTIAKTDNYIERIYENHKQEFLPEKTEGYVRIEAVENENPKDQKAQRILEIIEECKTFGYAAGDVTVLVRDNRRGAELAAFLMDNKYHVETGESLLFTQSKDVCLLLALIQYLSDRKNKLYRYELLYYSGFSEEINFDEKHELLQKPFFEFDSILSCFLGQAFNSGKLRQKNLFEICVSGIRIFNLNGNSVFISSFLDLVTEAQQWQNTLADFIAWWNEVKNKKSIQQNLSANAVKIMTIHKSKGLEFPVVILPDCDWKIKTTVKNVWVENVPDIEVSPLLLRVEKSMEKTAYAPLFHDEILKSKSDTVNLLYVATTRASERLYMLYEYSEQKNDFTQANHYIQLFLADKDVKNGAYEFGNAETTKIQKSKDLASASSATETDKKIVLHKTPSVIAREERLKQSHLQKSEDCFVPLVMTGYKVKLKGSTDKTLNEEHTSTGFATIYGNKLHTLIDLIASGGNSELIQQKIALEDDAIAAQLRNDIDFVLHNAELAPYFSDAYTRLTEFEILDEKGEIHKPDFIAIHKQTKTVAVLDFKTGKEQEKYRKQVQRYISLLEKGNRNVERGYLVYTQNRTVQTV